MGNRVRADKSEINGLLANKGLGYGLTTHSWKALLLQKLGNKTGQTIDFYKTDVIALQKIRWTGQGIIEKHILCTIAVSLENTYLEQNFLSIR